MRKVVVNSTPLIALCKIGRLDILKAMYKEILIPEAVYRVLPLKSVFSTFIMTSDML